MPQLEFHQLDRRLENLRVRHPARQRRLLASLAEAGQQTPIIVIENAGRYLVIDGHKRIAALQQLGRDTVDARRVGDERSRSAGAGTFAAHERAGDGARTRLAAGGDGKPVGLLDRGTGPALRPQPDLGGEPPGAGGDAAARPSSNRCAKARSPRKSRCATWCRWRASAWSIASAWPPPSPSNRGPRGKPVNSIKPGGRQWRGARTDPGRAEVIPQNARAAQHARKGTEPDHRHRATSAGASGISACPTTRP